MSKEKNDLTIKIFALIIAIILWSYVMSEVNPDKTVEYKNINITFSNIDALERQGLVVMEPKEANISVKVTGKTNDINKFTSQGINARVDLSGYSEGEIKVPVHVSLDQFTNIKITNYEPKEILFKFDKLITKEKNVTIKTTGKLEQGYVSGSPEVKSQSILLKGPRSWVNSVSEAVAIVDLSGRKETTNVTVPIKLIDDKGNDVRGVEKEPNVIDVSIPIFRSVKLPIELQTENQLPENYEITNITINPSSINLKGDKKALGTITSIKTVPIDINSLIENKNVEVELELPQNVELLNPDQKVTVTLNIEEVSTKTFDLSLKNVNIKNLDSTLVIDENDYDKTVQVTVKGAVDVIKDLTEEDLGLEIDLAELKEGIHMVNINMKEIEGVKIQQVTPPYIEITLKKH
ncbi:hypothetical protein KQI42_11020 [Tissierella sp. MSJ-40]|uniref:YbbR-like protein n=1 Tax=Tissierella simiarum TaxID=2841534 RepID=A0ABS6E6K7_9FIRM|nr:CdaR family protein [Tissierella simiarum]MBU5438545.1 hypothetical protein [Tissierella simiarum]